MKLLVINVGSSSMKYQLFDMKNESVLAKGSCERIGIDGKISGTGYKNEKFKYRTNLPTYSSAVYEIKKVLVESKWKVVSLKEIKAVGHRIVQGGAIFNKSVFVTEEVKEDIKEMYELAPLHNPAHIQGINACTEVFGKSMPQVAVFDNAFHSTMPEKAFLFPIPYEYYEKHKIRKYGFHGTSHRFISDEYFKISKRDLNNSKIITCHLGNGSSLTAIKNGKVIDTTMGLTPLDGIEMGTRCGAVDPSAIIYLQEKEKLTAHELSEILNKKSGLLGVSGISSDLRDIISAAKDGHHRANLAVDILIYQVTKYIGAFAAAMNGLDAIIFTGGIGENSDYVREGVLKNLTFLNVEFDEKANKKALGKEMKISKESSKVDVFVIPTNEELLIARDTLNLIENKKNKAR